MALGTLGEQTARCLYPGDLCLQAIWQHTGKSMAGFLGGTECRGGEGSGLERSPISTLAALSA